jgi:hypothetical protein
MSRYLISLVVAGIVMFSSHVALADTYDTVDAVQTSASNDSIVIRITGTFAGTTVPRTTSYRLNFGSSPAADQGSRCDRMALLAMSKPGKFLLEGDPRRSRR